MDFAYSHILKDCIHDNMSIAGLVRSPIATTVMQVSSRLLLIWAVVNSYPEEAAPSLFYSTMLLAWSVTEVIRYSYFVFNLQGGGVPGFVTWLRYNTFFVLYPIGIASECALIWKASVVAENQVTMIFWAILGIYVPGKCFRRGLKYRPGRTDWVLQGVTSFSRT